MIAFEKLEAGLPPDYSRNIPKWKLADTNNLAAYRITCGNLLNSTDMVLSSKDTIDMFLIHLTASLLSSADEHIPYGKFNSHIKPYWKNQSYTTPIMKCGVLEEYGNQKVRLETNKMNHM